jgi:membrane protein insertase Oxa1/YidC/SpoIIIJ
MIFIFTVNLPAALSLYWLVGGLVAFIQQSIVLRDDEEELEAIAAAPSKDAKNIPEAEIVTTGNTKKTPKKSSKKSKAKRRKK